MEQQERKEEENASKEHSFNSNTSSVAGIFYQPDAINSVGVVNSAIGYHEEAINIIEEHEEVPEDFGLGESDISMNQMNAAMNVNMNVDLNPIHLPSFLSSSEQEKQKKDPGSGQENTFPNGATNAYDASKEVVYYSRREDKMKQLREHPMIERVSPDGRQVICKCTRLVKLNPAWYILKFEQHLASRNCSLLKGKSKSSKKQQKKTIPTQSQVQTQPTQNAIQAQQQLLVVEDDTSASSSTIASISETCGLKTLDEICSTQMSDIDYANKMKETCDALRCHKYFNRITPDGKFIECVCTRVVILNGPWELSKFEEHITKDQCKKPYGKKNRALPTTSAQVATKNVVDGIPTSTITSTSRRTRKKINASVRWNPVEYKDAAPCPGLRDEQMSLYVANCTRLTGGNRPRSKIAQELFPDIFDGTTNGPTATNIIQQRLCSNERRLLNDAVQKEALWYVDKDGQCLRSLDCKGMIENGLESCRACMNLRNNITLRTILATLHKKEEKKANKICSSATVMRFLEAEFSKAFRQHQQNQEKPRQSSNESYKINLNEPYIRLLRDLFLMKIDDDSVLNYWFEMAEMGINGAFDSHPALIGLMESMVRMKDKELRGVGKQNMTYSEDLDTFMKALSSISPQASDYFQQHLCGRSLFRHRDLYHPSTSISSINSYRKRKRQAEEAQEGKQTEDSQNLETLEGQGPTIGPSSGNPNDTDSMHMSLGGLNMNNLTLNTIGLGLDGNVENHTESLVGLLESVTTGPTAVTQNNGPCMLPNLSIHDIQDVDLSSLSASAPAVAVAAINTHSTKDLSLEEKNEYRDGTTKTATATSDNDDLEEEELEDDQDDDNDDHDNDDLEDYHAPYHKLRLREEAFERLRLENPREKIPCTGLRGPKVNAYVSVAVQLVGGSRPRYVIAKELFPHVFEGDKQTKIMEKLSPQQRLILQDAVHRECLWRVDKANHCVRSLRCLRVAERRDPTCRVCRDLKSHANFRCTLSRAKAPRNLDNLKYVPSVFTESDPLRRKLSKNTSFRGLYVMVKEKHLEPSSIKSIRFWLRLAKMGLCGYFRTHPVFEGLIQSMIEIKDKERRGVGKQNMQYATSLDKFMHGFCQISTEAFELFAAQFCGRKIRSHKALRQNQRQLLQEESIDPERNTTVVTTTSSEPSMAMLPPPDALMHPHDLQEDDDLLVTRSISASEMEENQRLMDRMLDEVGLSVQQHLDQPHSPQVDEVAVVEQTHTEEQLQQKQSIEQQKRQDEDDTHNYLVDGHSVLSSNI